jgi:iron complex outermembrane receptor protein
VNLPGNLINKGFEVVPIIIDTQFILGLAANASFLSNKMENFAGFIQAGALNGQGLSNAFVQVVTNKNLFTVILCMNLEVMTLLASIC